MVEEVDLVGLEKMTRDIDLLPEGLRGNPLNIRKSQPTARYWRPLQDGTWVTTGKLPADPLSAIHYFEKGFKARNPQEKSSGEGQLSGKAEIKK